MRRFYTAGLLLIPFFCYSQTPTIITHQFLTGTVNAFAYGNGVYLATTSRTYRSTDAKTWTQLSDTVPTFAFLAFGNGIFVGIQVTGGLYSYVYSSTDGIHWTQRTSMGGSANELNFMGGAFWAVSNWYPASGPSTTITSSDGINWNGLDMGAINWGSEYPQQFNTYSVAYNGSTYVMTIATMASRGAPGGEADLLISPTGAPGTWSSIGSFAPPGLYNIAWERYAFYIVTGGGIITSTDGSNWGPFTGTLNGVTGAMTTGSFFTEGDSVYWVNGSILAVSTDGTNFTRLSGPNRIVSDASASNGLTLIGALGGLTRATGSVNFTLSASALFTALGSNGSAFVAASSDPTEGGSIFTSPDFVDWNYQRPVSYTSTVLYTGSNYAAAGIDSFYLSPNGTTWTANPNPAPLNAMGYGAGRYVAGQRASSPYYNLISSTDAINWSVVDSSNTFYYKIRYLNNTFYALGENQLNAMGTILRSTDGLHWQNITPQLDSGTSYYTDVFYDGTKYYFTGARNFSTFFSVSTTDPTNTSSYGAMGGVTSSGSGTPAGEYTPQSDDFYYHNGEMVGTAVSTANGHTYLIYSTDGMNWSADSLIGTGNARSIVSAADTFYIVGGDGSYYTVTFGQAPAPPTLLRFEAEAVRSFGGEDARLRWDIKGDSGIAYFLVQHSVDSIQWDSIGSVNAERRKHKGERHEDEVQAIDHYQFTQENPPAGANYYRLGITADNGQRSWSVVRKVEIKKDICIYPNPARDVLHVQLPEPGRSRLIIFNRGWIPVREAEGRGSDVTLELRSLSPGSYYLLVLQDGQRYGAEFIIQ
ncbi:MAG TPA: hypothetical protein VFE32_21405 [Puia sp.]|jgi:hypothetical protein|nr:hypothetical protein [Puia sp.]